MTAGQILLRRHRECDASTPLTGNADGDSRLLPTHGAAGRTSRTRVSRAWSLAVRHPATAVGIAAAATRLALIAVLLQRSTVLFPDERRYIDLAATVSSGRSADTYQPGYGQLLYNQTRPFSATLARLFDILGAGRWPGQLLAALCAVAVAVLTCSSPGRCTSACVPHCWRV